MPSYEVEVTRISSVSKSFVVEADDIESAMEKAEEEAKGEYYDHSEGHITYESDAELIH